MRRFLLILPILLSPSAAAAQPWASEPARLAGRQALAAAGIGRFAEAEILATTADPVARKIVTWTRLGARGSGATAHELVAWVEANPDWPQPETIIRRAEEALAGEPDDALVLRHFTRTPPRTIGAAQRFADALARAGRGAEAAAVLRAAWRAGPAEDGFDEGTFAERNAAILTSDDHWLRFDRLLWEGRTAAAGRLLPRLVPARRAVAEARLAFRGDREAGMLEVAEIGLIHDRARMLRRRDRDAEAVVAWMRAEPLQVGLPPAAARAIWAERQILARKVLRLGDAAAAYRLTANHGQPGPGEPRQEAEFLAGFIALRRLGDAAAAERHFRQIGEGSRSVITRARGAYWTGLALAARGEAAAARDSFAVAAAFPVTFYGQLASLALGEGAAGLSARVNAAALPEPPLDAARLFGARELSRAVVTLADLGASDRARAFLLRMEELAADAGDRGLVARLAVLIGRRDHAVWVARRAGADGVILLGDGWPTPYPAPADGAEPALVHAITRQESNFELGVVSSAGARGPMQLLPSTAQAVARRLGIPHATPMLTRDAAHNLRLGSAYINDMLARYAGAMPLAAAAYNAGPGRVDEWLVSIGDPRVPGGVHILDWIELIPFGETRNYVQRVVENVVVYRARDAATAGLPHPLLSLLEGRS